MSQKLIPFKDSEGKRWEHYFVDAKTGIIYYQRRFNEKKLFFSTKETNPNKAKRFANQEIENRLGNKKKNARTLIHEELEPWLLMKESEGLKADTLYVVRRAKKHIEEYWGEMLPSEINRVSFGEWCTWWTKNNPKIQMENAIKYFNNFCAYLHEKTHNGNPLLPSKITFRDPNRHIIRAQRAIKKERVFTHDEFLAIYKTALNQSDRMVVHFMYLMATRIDETLKLDFDRIILDAEVPLYRWTAGSNKSKSIGEHALHLSLLNPLGILRALRNSEGTKLLFPQKNDNQRPLREQQIDWAAWRKRADLSWHWTPHTFRHTCLTNLFNDARNPQAIICKQYRVSLQVAMDVYVKVTRESMYSIRDSIRLEL